MEDKKIMVTIALDELVELKHGYDMKNYYAKEVEDWKKHWAEDEQKLRELEQKLAKKDCDHETI